MRSEDTDSDPARALLLDAINLSNLHRLRAILTEICTESTHAYDIACHRLLVELEDDSSSNLPPGSEGDSEGNDLGDGTQDEEEAISPPKDKKHKALTLRFEMCEQCEEEYNVEENYEDACLWHAGMYLHKQIYVRH